MICRSRHSSEFARKTYALLSTICFHLYFHPVVQNFRKQNDSFAGQYPNLSKLFFLQKHTYHSEKIPHNFGVSGQHTAELGYSIFYLYRGMEGNFPNSRLDWSSRG